MSTTTSAAKSEQARDASKSLEGLVGDPDNWGDMEKIASILLVPGVSDDDVVHFYNEWAKKGYHEYLQDTNLGYGAPKVMTKAMEELFPDPAQRSKASILDVGAGTGIIGQMMKDLGFSVVDALDPAQGMLNVAKEKGIYRNYYPICLNETPSDIPANSYDAIILVGVVGHGHLPCGAFKEMARLIKPGGFIVNCMRAAYLKEVPDYVENWETMVKDLEKEGRWKVVKMEKYPNHFIGKDGMLTVFQGC